jgi:hypothetical protein
MKIVEFLDFFIKVSLTTLTINKLVCSFLYICIFVLGMFHAVVNIKTAPDVVFFGGGEI